MVPLMKRCGDLCQLGCPLGSQCLADPQTLVPFITVLFAEGRALFQQRCWFCLSFLMDSPWSGSRTACQSKEHRSNRENFNEAEKRAVFKDSYGLRTKMAVKVLRLKQYP